MDKGEVHQMSNFIKALIAVGILLVIGFFVGKSCSKEEVTIRESEPSSKIEQLKSQIVISNAQRGKLWET